MMKGIVKGGLLLSALLSVFLFSNVKAESYYTNKNGVEMSETEYNTIKTLFQEDYVSVITQDEFNKYKNANIIDTVELFQKEIIVNGEVISQENVTEEEYNAYLAEKDTNDSKSGGSSSYETSYKRLVGSIIDNGNHHYAYAGSLAWKKVPKVRSYDVFAFRLLNFTYSGVTGSQVYFTSGGHSTISYNSSSAGYKGLSNGAGLSMNLKDGSNITGYTMTMTANLTGTNLSYGHGTVYVSYQHATANLTRAESMSYSISGTGMGGVVLFSSGYLNSSYDNMSGISVNAGF